MNDETESLWEMSLMNVIGRPPFLLSPKTDCGKRIDERVMNEGSVSEDGKAGWVERIFERTFTKERSTELRPIIGVLKSLHC